jgi:hypothetical protein
MFARHARHGKREWRGIRNDRPGEAIGGGFQEETSMSVTLRATLACGFAAFLALAAPARAEEETKVVKPDGQSFTVRSDEAGTTVSNDGKTKGAADVTPMEAQHQERVQELLKGGGVITEQKSLER